MQHHHVNWRVHAEAKVADTLSKIPDEWRLKQDVIKDAKNRRQLAGDFMLHLLDRDTVRCISHDSKEIVDLIGKKIYTSLQVAQAFCKTAAVAHQIVRISWVFIVLLLSSSVLLMRTIRIIVYMRFSLIKQSKGQKSWMIISRKTERHWVHCMACLSV